MELRRYIKKCAFVLGVGMLLQGAPAHAQTTPPASQLALSVSPAIVDIALLPGQPKIETVAVANVTDQPVLVEGRVRSFTPLEPTTTSNMASFDAVDWVSVSEPDFILQPHQNKSINIVVTPPKNAEPGGHYATIFFQPLAAEQEIKNNTAYIGSKVGVLGLFTVAGNIQEQAYVQYVGAPLLAQPGAMQIHVGIANTGNIHFIPTGFLQIQDMWGHIIKQFSIPPYLVLPHTTKDFAFSWDNPGRIGFFSVQATAAIGVHKHQIYAAAGMLIAPWALWLVLASVLGGIFVVGHSTRGRWRRALKAFMDRK